MSPSVIRNPRTAFYQVDSRSHAILSYLTEINGLTSNAIIFKTVKFSENFIAFSKSTYNFEYFEKKITFIASACPELFLPKNVVTSMP